MKISGLKFIFLFSMIFLGSFLVFSKSASAATYYMRADGTATTLAASTGCGSAATAMHPGAFNALTTGINDGDTVILCSGGGDYISTLIMPLSGSSSGITFTNATGETPVISGAIKGDSLPVGAATELLTNGDFELGTNCPTGWTCAGTNQTWSVVAGTRTGGAGSNVAQVAATGSGNPDIYQNVTVTGGKWYILSYWHIKTAGTCAMAPLINDGGTKYLLQIPSNWHTTNQTMNNHSTNQTSWTQRAMLFRTYPGQTNVRIEWKAIGCSNETIQFDDWSLKAIQWEQLSGNEYYLSIPSGLIGFDVSNVYQGYLSRAVAYLNGSPLTAGTAGSLNTGESAWDATNNRFSVNVGGDPTTMGDFEIPILSYSILANGKDYINISGLTLKYSGIGSSWGASIAALTSAATNWSITKSTFSSHPRFGIYLDSNNHTSWTIGGSAANRNVFTNIWNGRAYGSGGNGEAIDIESVNSTGVTVSYNNLGTVYQGIMSNGAGQLTAYNVITNTKVNGYDQTADNTANPVMVYNNSIYHTGIGHGFSSQVGGHGLKWKNNASEVYYIVTDSNYPHCYSISEGNNIEADYNAGYIISGSSANTKISRLSYTGQIVSPDTPTPPTGCSYTGGNTLRCSTMAGLKAAMLTDTLNNNATLVWTGDGTNGNPAFANSVGDNQLFISSSDLQLTSTSTAIDAGTDVSLTTDYAGNSIYGTPDIGAYEYQPPYTFAANDIPTTGSVRLYSDGQYRMLTATTTTATSSFSVIPASGSYLSTTTQYMDITIDSWLTSGTKNKQWTASSTSGTFQTLATSTLYTIGDLAANKYYQFKLDGVASSTAITGYGSTSCTDGICLSDSGGQIQFTYSGGYSTHTFSLEQNGDAPTNVGISSITAGSISQITIVAQTATDADPGLHSTPYYFAETTGHDGGSSSSWQNSITFIDTGLSSNTQYTYQVKAKDANSNESAFSTATSTYTLAPTPTNLAGTAGLITMDLSVDSFTNATADSSGYYFSRSGTNSGWVQTNSWSDSGLTCGTSYEYSVKYRNGDGTETATDSLTDSTTACPSTGGGGMPSEWNNPPKTPIGGFGISINNGVESTSIPTVILNLKGGSDTARMALSNFSDFRDAGLENYTSTSTKLWNLCWKNSILQTPLTCPNGTYTVYAKFFAPWGTASDVVSTKITLVSGTQNPTNQTPKPSATAKFTKDLRLGQTDNQVKSLQQFLNQNGFKLANTGAGSPNNETSYFGKLTQSALIKFQEAHKLDEKGSLGPRTREYINSLMNAPVSAEKPAETTSAAPSARNPLFTKDLKPGQTDADVRRLQVFLNSDSDTRLADSGIGSSGKETNFFGSLTKAAVIKFQEKYAAEVLTPLGLKKGTGIVSKNTRTKINQLLGNK